MRKAKLRILLALLAPAALALAEKTTDYSDEFGTFTVKLPEEWTVAVHLGRKRKADLMLKITPPEAEKGAYFYVWNKRAMRGPRAQAWYEGPRILKDQKGESWSIEMKPLPHVIIAKKSRTSGAARVYVVSYRVVRGNGLKMALSCRTALWEKIKAVYFDMVQNMSAAVSEFPPRPESYKGITKDGYLYLLHPDVRSKAIKDLHRQVTAEEKAFSKLHGKLRRDPNQPVAIVVHAKKEDALDVSPEAAESYSGFHTDRNNRRLFAVPLGVGKEPRAYLGSQLRSLFFTMQYGDNQPYWIHEGEVRAAWVTAMAGRKLPALSPGYKSSIPDRFVGLQQLPMLQGADLTNQAFCYVAFFEAGPGKYQKAFKSFLRQFAATGDWRAAQKKYLLGLDQARLAKDLAKFAKNDLK
jgi:hypothetical protein